MGLGCQVAQSGIPRKGVTRTMYGLLRGRGDQSYSFLARRPEGERLASLAKSLKE